MILVKRKGKKKVMMKVIAMATMKDLVMALNQVMPKVLRKEKK